MAASTTASPSTGKIHTALRGFLEHAEKEAGHAPFEKPRSKLPYDGEVPEYPTIEEPLFTQRHIQHLNRMFQSVCLKDLLKWCAITIPNMVQVTSFGPTGMVLLDYLHKMEMKLPTIYLDTLHHFDESIAHAKLAAEAFNLDLRV